jgi:hypothetical protein
MTIPATIIDFHAIGKIFLAALIVGVGMTFLFAQGALAAERLTQSRASGTATQLRDGALVTLAAAACIAALILGVVAMTKK